MLRKRLQAKYENYAVWLPKLVLAPLSFHQQPEVQRGGRKSLLRFLTLFHYLLKGYGAKESEGRKIQMRPRCLLWVPTVFS